MKLEVKETEEEFAARYPMITLNSKHIEEIRTITEFLEATEARDIRLCQLNVPEVRNYPVPSENLVFEHFGIDKAELEAERGRLYREYVHPEG